SRRHDHGDGYARDGICKEHRRSDRLHASRQGSRNRACLDPDGADDAGTRPVRGDGQSKIITGEENPMIGNRKILGCAVAACCLVVLAARPAQADLLDDITQAKKIRISTDLAIPPSGMMDSSMK